MINYRDTPFGFDYGAATVERMASDENKGWVVLGITTPKTTIQVYVTKTGKITVRNSVGEKLTAPERKSE